MFAAVGVGFDLCRIFKKSKIKGKSNVKGSGHECPLYTISNGDRLSPVAFNFSW
jgi:hypothetical protein